MALRYLEDYSVGQTFRSGSIRITADDIKRFAREFDPQPFHLDETVANTTIFRGLAASGWHTAALTMKLLVASDFVPANGIIGAGFDELLWPRPVRPGDDLQVEIEVLTTRPSKSNQRQGLVKLRFTTVNQNHEPVQVSVGTIVVIRRP
jgi:acyl dehydratase